MMTGMLLILTFLGYGPWELTGPEGGHVKSPIQSPQNAAELWTMAGTSPVTIVHSTDAGLHWTPISRITTSSAYDMAITQTGTLVVSGYGAVWVSKDGGKSWAQHTHYGTSFKDIVAHPTNGNELFATGYKYIGGKSKLIFLHSTNGGVSFSTKVIDCISGDNVYGYYIAVSHSSPSNILIGGYSRTSSTYTPSVARSTNGGTSFSSVSPSTSGYYSYGVAIHPSNPNILLASTAYDMFRSVNGGSSWTKVGNRMYYASRPQFSLVDNNIVLAAGNDRIHRSTNGGQSWTSVSANQIGEGAEWIVPSWKNKNIAFTSSTAGFYRSTDAGQRWSLSNSGQNLRQCINMIESQGYIYLNSFYGLLFRTPATGTVAWKKVKTPLTCGNYCAISTNGSDTILALEGGG